MSDSINSLSPNFRDFLLNRNLITDTVTDNGLQSLLVGIGDPIPDMGTLPEAVQPSPDIVGNGDVYKDLNIVTNQFQGDVDDYRLADITYRVGLTPRLTPFIYTSNYTQNQGVLNDTLNTPANGPFQGGDIRQFNTSRNLYDDPDMRLLVNIQDTSAPNVKYTNYLELNASIVDNEIDILGTILNGQGVGIGVNPNNNRLVPSFDLRASLMGRVLGGTGIISDTPIGQAGAKYLALALGNNLAFGLQQETIGKLNLNPLSLLMNGLDSFIVRNFNITVPSGTLGRALDYTARVLGFESPLSLYERSSSIFSIENPVSNIDRANAQIANTGKGQVLTLFSNIKTNTDPRFTGSRQGYAPGFTDNRIQDEDKGINPNIYAFESTNGAVIDLLNNVTSTDFNQDDNSTPNEFDPNHLISQSNYRLDGLISNSGFKDSPNDAVPVNNDTDADSFIWGDDKSNAAGKRVFGESSIFTNPKTILSKTKRLFATNKMRTIVSGKGGIGVVSETMSAVQGGIISKGSGVLSQQALDGDFSDTDNIYCRAWSTMDRYNQVDDLQKHSDIDKKSPYRDGYVAGDSVLDTNGFVRVAPFVGDVSKDNIKNFMFSLENLAWADDHAKLLQCELGPGDQMGKRGRIMWFPPYDITINENTAVNWESTNFIGRGEPIYTYSNTERTGTLQFKIVVDHPSYLNALKGETDEAIASFFAGCTDIDTTLASKLTTIERDTIETKNAPPAQQKTPDPIFPDVRVVAFYFSNDNYNVNPLYEDGVNGGLGTTTGQGIVGKNNVTYDDNSDFNLNKEGGWITIEEQDKLKKVLNVDCPACKVVIEGGASTQGNSDKNVELSQRRADSVKDWFLDNDIIDDTQEIYTNTISINDRFKRVIGLGEDSSGDCPVIKDDNGKIIPNQDSFGCKIPRKVTVFIIWDAELQSKIDKNELDPVVGPEEKYRVSRKITNRFYNECNYFEKIKQDDKFVYDSIGKKLKFFHPAFHAITPEGLNSRLTFLQQCTRQGPTNISGKPDNLAFGRPPICILRLGDFYHTKIAIDNVGISYEPLVWDLNPEGIGVQPMIATVDLSFKMIGGQSLKGPINKLQNAVSFNFFGNTQVYDERADKLVAKEKPEQDAPRFELVPGLDVLGPTIEVTESKEKSGTLNADGDDKVAIDQEALAEKQDLQEQEPLDDNEVIKQIGLKSFIFDGTTNQLTLKFIFNQKTGSDLNLDDSVRGSVYIKDTNSSEQTFIGRPGLGPFDTNTIQKFTNSDDLLSLIDSTAIEFTLKIDLSKERAEFVTETLTKDGFVLQVQWTNTGKSKNTITFKI